MLFGLKRPSPAEKTPSSRMDRRGRDGGTAVRYTVQPHLPSALLHLQPAHEIALAQRHTIGAQDVVGGGGVEIEVRQRERHQEALGREGQLVIAEEKDDVAAAERI